MRKFGPVLIALAMAISAPALAQVPRAADGKPDLTGIWTNASLTPLARDRSVTKLTVNDAEAQAIVAKTGLAGISADDPEFRATYSDPTKGAPEKGGADFGLKGYDGFWVAPGERLAKVKGEWRTSNIVEPANGQLPYKNPAAIMQKQMKGFQTYMTGNAPYEGPEEPTLSERCLIGFGQTGGPGMLSVLYNNNYQFVQTPEHMMILVEMAHDARIVPIFASADEARKNHRPNAIKPWMGDSGWSGWLGGNSHVRQAVRQSTADCAGILSATGKTCGCATRCAVRRAAPLVLLRPAPVPHTTAPPTGTIYFRHGNLPN